MPYPIMPESCDEESLRVLLENFMEAGRICRNGSQIVEVSDPQKNFNQAYAALCDGILGYKAVASGLVR